MNAFIRRKAFGEEVIFSDEHYGIPEGKCTAVLGPSGSGKTTLLRILSGLDHDYDGCIDDPPSHPLVLFQEDRLVENISVLSNMLLVAPDRRTAMERLEEAGLEEDRGKTVSALSGGMKRKLALARFMLLDGDALFLDEPFRALDDDSRIAAADRIMRFRRGRTMLFITHDEEDLALLGTDFTIRLA